MGVPKFFRYISERYPCLSEKLKEYQISEFDNLYLDMNGIVHQCSHPNDEDVQFRLTEDEIFRNIFHYIDVLFRMIQPKELFFLAVDGVAPRAKINQQRGRRFRTAKEAEMAEQKAKAKGIEIPKEQRFDSNCITPGTCFMMKLNQNLKSFIEYKISVDKLWQKCTVIFSGSEVPGEGEHKIMDYIRYMKAQPNYNPNTRHCLYGLDADLIMLGLCSHEPHFSLLREEVKFGKKAKRILTPEETNFCLLHLSLLREYIEHEFSPLKEKLSFPFDLEKMIDDWVLMGFLVGNDFIPHLPNLHIAQGALAILYQVYMELLPTLDGYINEAGTLRLDRFEKLMEKLSRIEMEQFADHYADLKYFEAKTQRRLNEVEKPTQEENTNTETQNESAPKIQNDALGILVKSSSDMFLEYLDENPSNEDSESSDEVYQMEFIQHKKEYYMNKLGDNNIDEEFLRSQAKCYVNAIQWNLHYYYHGCCSWSWFYPHHYAPFITDIKDFRDLKLEFDLGEPFLPFEQLLAVLPSYSRELLPQAFQHLLTDEESPIIDYYPNNFNTDLNGKKQEWEAVVLIPFINEKRLQTAMSPYYSQLTKEEQMRNKYGPFNIFSYSKKALGKCESNYFPAVSKHARVELKNREDIVIPRKDLIQGLYPGLKLDEYFPGFPSLQHIKHTAKLEKAKVKVFEQPSRGDNMVLKIIDSPELDKMEELLGKHIYVNWPYLTEAQITGVSNSNEKKFLTNLDKIFDDSGELIMENVGYESFNKTNKAQFWNSRKKVIEDVYRIRFGIDIGTTNYLIHARLFVGTQYVFENDGTTSQKNQWSEESIAYAHQTIPKTLIVHKKDPVIYKNIHEIYESNSVCFMLGRPHYGAMGLVMDPEDNRRATRIKVSMNIAPEPNSNIISEIQAKLKNQKYMPANIAAQALGITSHLLSRITGTIYVTVGSLKPQEASNHNIGLKLKFNKKNEEVPGYTRKTNGQWFYSNKATDLIKDYMRHFPNLFERLTQNASHDIFVENELFSEGSSDLKNIIAWLKQQSFRNVESRACGSEMLEPDTVHQLERGLDEFSKSQQKNSKTIVMQIRPHLLFKPGMYDHLPPDKDCTTQLFDRIICVRENFTVPLGHKGIVIGIQKAQNKADTTYDILFDTCFEHGLSLGGCSNNRGYRLSFCDFINISHGERTEIKPNSRETEASSSTVKSWRQPTPQSSPTCRSTSAFTSLNKNHTQSKPSAPEYVFSYSNHQQDKFKGNYNNRQTSIANNGNWRSPQMVVMPNSPNPSSIKLNNQVHGVPSHHSHISNQRPSHEFQALWNELHNQPPIFSMNKQPMTGEIPTPPVMKPTGVNAPEDPSAFLKALLKITDESTPKLVPSGANAVRKTSNVPAANPTIAPTLKPQKSTDTPPIVQQLFDHARQTGKKRSPISYCAHILNHCQMNGMGVPQYMYFPDPRTSLICSEINIPGLSKFIGEPCPSHEQAAESVAKKVYETLKLHKAPKPIRDVLLTPPQDYPSPPNRLWLRGGPDLRIQKMHKNNNQIQVPNCRYQELDRNNTQIQAPNLRSQEINKNNSQIQTPHLQQMQKLHQRQPQQQYQPNSECLKILQEKPKLVHHNNRSSEPKVENTPFVPLQAQKKHRNTSVQQNMKSEEQKVRGSQKHSQMGKQQMNNKDNVANTSNSHQEQIAQVMMKEKPIAHNQNETGVQPTTQKSNKTRRSRLAARFNVSTADDIPK